MSPHAGPDRLKQVAVLSFSGYDEVIADIGFIGKLSDNPDLARGVEVILNLLTKNQGLKGLDKSRPWGAVIRLDEEKLAEGSQNPMEYASGVAFLPVTDADALQQVLEPYIGQPTDVGDGVQRVENEGNELFLKPV